MSAFAVAKRPALNLDHLSNIVWAESPDWPADAVMRTKEVFAQLRVLHAQSRLTDRTITLIHDFQTTAARWSDLEQDIKEYKLIINATQQMQSVCLEHTNHHLPPSLEEQEKQNQIVEMEIQKIKSCISQKEDQVKELEAKLSKNEKDQARYQKELQDARRSNDKYRDLEIRSNKGLLIACQGHEMRLNTEMKQLRSEITELNNQLKKKEAEKLSPKARELQEKLKAIQSNLMPHLIRNTGTNLDPTVLIPTLESRKHYLGNFTAQRLQGINQMLLNLKSLGLEVDNNMSSLLQAPAWTLKESTYWTADDVLFVTQIFDKLAKLESSVPLTERTVSLMQAFEKDGIECGYLEQGIKLSKEWEAKRLKCQSYTPTEIMLASQKYEELEAAVTDFDPYFKKIQSERQSEIEKIKSEIVQKEQLLKEHEHILANILEARSNNQKYLKEAVALPWSDKYRNQNIGRNRDLLQAGEIQERSYRSKIAKLQSDLVGLQNGLKLKEATNSIPLEEQKRNLLHDIKQKKEHQVYVLKVSRASEESLRKDLEMNNEIVLEMTASLSECVNNNRSRLISLWAELEKQKPAADQTAAAAKK